MDYYLAKLYDREFMFSLLSTVGAFGIAALTLWVVLSDERRTKALVIGLSIVMFMVGMIVGLLGIKKKKEDDKK